MMGTQYEYGNKCARPIDSIAGDGRKKIDCSGFVRNVFDQVFPLAGLSTRNDLNALKFATEDLFIDTNAPLSGDIVCWDGHVGIVYDETKGLFIGSQTSTGVFVASYKSGYWATAKVVKKFRKWKTL